MSDTPPNTFGKWAYSSSGEGYSGECGRWWEAALEYFEETFTDEELATTDTGTVSVGMAETPRPAEEMLSGRRFIELAIDSTDGDEDYSGEWCTDWMDDVSGQAVDDLEARIGKAFGEWMDAHGCRPSWFVVRKSWSVTYAQAKAAEAQKEDE